MKYKLATPPIEGDTFGSGMIDFTCVFEAPDGSLDGEVHWYRHKDQPALAVGETYPGSIESKNGKKKFVVEKGQRSGEPRRVNSTQLAQATEAAAGRPRDDVGARIERQTAWKVAAMLALAQATAGTLTVAADVRGLRTMVEDIERHIGEAGQPPATFPDEAIQF